MLSIAFVNTKAGTGKTTSAVWLAHAFAAANRPVLLVDADPQGSALEWSDLAESFPFRLLPMASEKLHLRILDYARPDEVVIIDAPQLEDHAGIARSALRFADEVVIPCAPTVVEISRTAPMRAEIEAMASVRLLPPRSAVLLNRAVTNANSIPAAREAFGSMGFDVLRTLVPRLELYAQSYGAPLPLAGADIWCDLAIDLINRAETPEMAR
jgi:chromosome partitioning protein